MYTFIKSKMILMSLYSRLVPFLMVESLLVSRKCNRTKTGFKVEHGKRRPGGNIKTKEKSGKQCPRNESESYIFEVDTILITTAIYKSIRMNEGQHFSV